jgi:F0F1-type ATP synthase membrane subunit c/vacuolar-type H+-ATPase subunit K
MRRLRLNGFFPKRLGVAPLGLLVWLGCTLGAVAAGPANDNFASAATRKRAINGQQLTEMKYFLRFISVNAGFLSLNTSLPA